MSVLRTSTLRSVSSLRAGARFASTDASASGSASGSSDTAPRPGKLPMTWTEYFQMRKRRKNWSNLTSIPSSIGGLALGASYMANLDADLSQPILGMDPMMMMGGATVAAGLGGYLVGPTIGNALFSMTHPKLARGNPPPLEVMDREFYHRIKSKRADPSRQSVTNPAPDFYGEKIVSIPTYRRWLKDQQAYMRKVSHGVPGEDEE